MRTDKVRPYLDRVGRVCGVKGCGAVLHDEARFCARCGASTRFHDGWKAWWQGVFFPARCSRCRCLILNAAHPFCRRCGKEDGANAYERDSVPQALRSATLTLAVAWIVLGLLFSRIAAGPGTNDFLSIGAIIVAGVIASIIGAGVYCWMRNVHAKLLAAEEVEAALRIAKRRPTRRLLRQWTYSG